MSEQILSIQINAKEKPVEAKVNRMVYYHRMKVIEVIEPNNEYFYLIFYKDQFITGINTQLNKKSQLKKLFQKGIVFSFPHPLIDAFLKHNETYHLKPIDQLLISLSKTFTPQEVSLILTHFDSVLPKEQIINTIKEFFYSYRRNGQLRLAYQLLVILLSFAPKNDWAIEVSNQMEYLRYRKSYDKNEIGLSEADPLYMELLYFKNRDQKRSFDWLQTMLSQKSKWGDKVALYIDQLNHSKTFRKQHYDCLINLLHEHFSELDGTLILWKYYRIMPLDDKMIQQLVDRLLNHNMYEDTLNVITDQRQSSQANMEQILSIFQQKTLNIQKINWDDLRSYLIDEPSPQDVEALLHSIIPRLLDDYEIADVYKWLQPLFQLELQISILETIQMMFLIKDDPEQQLSLGKLYYKLKQNHKAIECFKWEMELTPSDPIPVQWLSKLYREIGMIEEANNYMYIYSSLHKASS